MPKEIKFLLKFDLGIGVLAILLGLLLREQTLYLGFGLGAILASFGLYRIYVESKVIAYGGSPSGSIRRYLTRYILYGVYLGLLVKFISFDVFIAGVLGLLTTKLGIFFHTGTTLAKEFIHKYDK